MMIRRTANNHIFNSDNGRLYSLFMDHFGQKNKQKG